MCRRSSVNTLLIMGKYGGGVGCQRRIRRFELLVSCMCTHGVMRYVQYIFLFARASRFVIRILWDVRIYVYFTFIILVALTLSAKLCWGNYCATPTS